ncbi:MAG: hypothetical protein U0176_25510 [Bacteroidia bacterium]
MTTRLMHLADVRVRWMRRRLLYDHGPPGRRNLTDPIAARLNAFIEQGDRLDESGLYLRALEQYRVAMHHAPLSSRAYRKAAMTLIKSGDLLHAREYLDLAALYAKNSNERLRVLHTKYLLVATEMEREPCLSKLKEQYQVLDLGLLERPDDIILIGGYVVASTFVLWKLAHLPEVVLLDIHRIGLHYHALLTQAATVPTDYNQKYAARLREEIRQNIDHLPPTLKEIWKIHATMAH